MKAAKTFKEALDVLEKIEFRNGVELMSVQFVGEADGHYVAARLTAPGAGIIGSIRLVNVGGSLATAAGMGTRKFWVDGIERFGDGGPESRQQQLELAEDLIKLAKAWEGK